MKPTLAVFGTIGALILVAALAVAGWQLHWFVAEKNVDRQVRIDNRNLGTQTAWRDEAVNAVGDFHSVDPTDTAYRGVLRGKACGLIGRLRPDYLDLTLTDFRDLECAR